MADGDELDPLAEWASKMGASGATLLLIGRTVEHDRVLPVRQDVPSAADDQRAVKSPGQSLRSMVCAHGVVVVVPVTGAARHPSAVLGRVTEVPATPYIGSDIRRVR